MAKLPSTKRILKEDIPDAPGWTTRIIGPLNQLIESVYSALNKNITFRDNIDSQIKELDFQTPSDYSTKGFNKLQFQRLTRVRAEGVLVLQIFEKESNELVLEPVSIAWSEANNEIRVVYITGLKPDTKYRVSLLVI